MTSKRKRAAGLSLVELLLAMAIIGVIFLAVMALTRSTLGYSARVDVVNDSLVELNDAIGYIALNARRSARLLDESDSLRIYHESTGEEFICAPNKSDLCIGMIVPVVDRDSAEVKGYELLAYRAIPISKWLVNPGIPEGWDEGVTKVLLEYRTKLCNCSTPPTTLSGTVYADYTSFLLSDLYLLHDDGSGFAPFVLVGEDQLHISLRLKSRKTGPVIPKDGPVGIVVSRRP